MSFNGWQIKRVLATNLFSYSALKVDFSTDSTALVLGQNMDDAGANSNGAGKSSLFDIITWTVWGKTPRSEDFAGDILRRGTEHASASVIFVDENGRELNIIRENGKKNVLKAFVLIESEQVSEDLTLRTPTLTQRVLCKFLGYDEKKGFADYLSQVYFSTASSKGFLGAEVQPVERQQVLERFLGLSILDNAHRYAKDDLKLAASAIQGLDAQYKYIVEVLEGQDDTELLRGKLSDIEKTLTECRAEVSILSNALVQFSDLSTEHISAKNVYKDVAEKFRLVRAEAEAFALRYEKLRIDNEQGLKLRDEWVSVYQEDYEKCIAEESKLRESLLKLRERRQPVATELADLKMKLAENTRKITAFERQRDKVQVCPHCGKDLFVNLVTGDVSAGDRERVVKMLDEELARGMAFESERFRVAGLLEDFSDKETKLLRLLDDLKRKHASLIVERDKYEAFDLSAFDDLSAQASELDVRYQTRKIEHGEALVEIERVEKVIVEKLSKCLADIGRPALVNCLEIGQAEASIREQIRLGSVRIEDLISQKGQIEETLKTCLELVETLKKVNTELSERRALSAKITYWTDVYPDIKRKILKAFVPTFENVVNTYLSELEIAERVKFATEADKRDGTGTKAGFYIDVFDGRTWAGFKSYSGGEKSRIMVAVGFALRKLALQRASGSTFNFLLVDELLDNIDSTGIHYFFTLLNRMHGQKFLITHTNVDEVTVDTDCQVVITKQDGKSNIEVLY